MSDRKRNHEKKEKQVETEKMNKEYVEMPTQYNQDPGNMQHNCPMMYQCPMVQQCPMMSRHSTQMPTAQYEDMSVKDWFEEWDEFSEVSSSESDDQDFYSPEKYYGNNNSNHQYPYFFPQYFPSYKK